MARTGASCARRVVLEILEARQMLSAASPGVPEPVAMADFDGDGRADVLLASRFLHAPRPVHRDLAARLLIQTTGPDGTLKDWATLDMVLPGTAGIGVAVGDLDGDGRADVVIRAYGQQPGDSTQVQTILVGAKGEMTAGAAIKLPVADPGSSPPEGVFGQGGVFATDLNRDGLADILAVNQRELGYAVSDGKGGAALRGSGNNPLYQGGGNEVSNPLFKGRVAGTGDLNGDGFPELIGLSDGKIVAATVGIKGDTFFTRDATPKISDFGMSRVTQVLVGDVNGDGLADVVAFSQRTTFAVLLSTSKGDECSLRGIGESQPAAKPRHIFLADFDGDRDADLVQVKSKHDTAKNSVQNMR